jgi:hypothetical protein
MDKNSESGPIGKCFVLFRNFSLQLLSESGAVHLIFLVPLLAMMLYFMFFCNLNLLHFHFHSMSFTITILKAPSGNSKLLKTG